MKLDKVRPYHGVLTDEMLNIRAGQQWYNRARRVPVVTTSLLEPVGYKVRHDTVYTTLALSLPYNKSSVPKPNTYLLPLRMIAIFDEDGGGDVDFQEFVLGLSAFSARGHKEEKLKFAFKVYDIDRDGYISNGELFIVLKMMVGSNLKDQQLQQIVDKTIMEADKDGDGKISFQEFAAMVENTDVSMSMTLGEWTVMAQLEGIYTNGTNRPILGSSAAGSVELVMRITNLMKKTYQCRNCYRTWPACFSCYICVYKQRPGFGEVAMSMERCRMCNVANGLREVVSSETGTRTATVNAQ